MWRLDWLNMSPMTKKKEVEKWVAVFKMARFLEFHKSLIHISFCHEIMLLKSLRGLHMCLTHKLCILHVIMFQDQVTWLLKCNYPYKWIIKLWAIVLHVHVNITYVLHIIWHIQGRQYCKSYLACIEMIILHIVLCDVPSLFCFFFCFVLLVLYSTLILWSCSPYILFIR